MRAARFSLTSVIGRRSSGLSIRPTRHSQCLIGGALPGVAGAHVATGHSICGILNAPATGEAIADLILDGAPRALDLTPFRPARLSPFEAVRLQTAIPAAPDEGAGWAEDRR
jgi:glycine/D-amino acid oxidase-like deaminating enzyme